MLCSEAGIFLKWSRRTNSAKSPNQKQRLFGSTLKRHTLPVPVMLSSKRIMDHGFLVFFGIRFNQIFGVVCACCCTRPVFQGLLSVHRSVLTCEKTEHRHSFFSACFRFGSVFFGSVFRPATRLFCSMQNACKETGSFFPTDIRFFCFQMVQMLFLYKATEKAIQSFFLVRHCRYK